MDDQASKRTTFGCYCRGQSWPPGASGDEVFLVVCQDDLILYLSLRAKHLSNQASYNWPSYLLGGLEVASATPTAVCALGSTNRRLATRSTWLCKLPLTLPLAYVYRRIQTSGDKPIRQNVRSVSFTYLTSVSTTFLPTYLRYSYRRTFTPSLVSASQHFRRQNSEHGMSKVSDWDFCQPQAILAFGKGKHRLVLIFTEQASLLRLLYGLSTMVGSGKAWA